MNPVIFFILALVTVCGAVMVVWSRSPVSSILFLLMTFFGIAAIYVFLGAQFLAAVQLIVYAGAILVLFLFAVMLLNIGKIEEKGAAFFKALGIVCGGIILILLATIIGANSLSPTPGPELVSTAALGDLLFTTDLIPFECASVLLLVAIVGAVVLVKKRSA